MPVIRVQMFKGRSREQKRLLVGALTDAYVSVAGALMADRYPDS